jgi:hypothetical protein
VRVVQRTLGVRIACQDSIDQLSVAHRLRRVGVIDLGDRTTMAGKGLAGGARQPFRAREHLTYVVDLLDASERDVGKRGAG